MSDGPVQWDEVIIVALDGRSVETEAVDVVVSAARAGEGGALVDDSAAIEAMCEDHRAGASIDVVDDDADRDAAWQITCPVPVLWAGRGGLHGFDHDVLDVWRPRAPDVEGRAIDASHFLAEDRPEEIAAELLGLLGAGDLTSGGGS